MIKKIILISIICFSIITSLISCKGMFIDGEILEVEATIPLNDNDLLNNLGYKYNFIISYDNFIEWDDAKSLFPQEDNYTKIIPCYNQNKQLLLIKYDKDTTINSYKPCINPYEFLSTFYTPGDKLIVKGNCYHSKVKLNYTAYNDKDKIDSNEIKDIIYISCNFIDCKK